MKIISENYMDLLNAACATATAVLERTPKPDSLVGRARFIHDRAKELANIEPIRYDPSANRVGVGYDALDLLVSNWENVAAEVTSGEDLLRERPEFWPRLMIEWPMGAYVTLTVDFLRKNQPLRGKRILEVGAGVGAVARRMPELGTEDYIRSDINPFIAPRDLPGRVARYDFNRKGEWNGLDIIFGVNALHCARSPALSICFLSEMLRSGGLLLLAEGQSQTTPDGTPWALNLFFGLFDGWWNVGGFRDRETWLRDLEAAGLQDIDYCSYESEGHALGGLVWGRKP
jgi:SAM-dependent methyltransferase